MIPISIDHPLRRTPLVTYALIGISVIVALVQAVAVESPTGSIIALNRWLLEHGRLISASSPARDPATGEIFAIAHMELWQFVTYQFMHAGFWHLAGNMVFLWVFGPAIEDRFGHLGFLLFFLAGGIIAGGAHCLVSPAPVIGASGSISAVTGVFLAMFPNTRVRILWIFLVISIIEIPSLWFIGASFALDVIRQLGGGGHVAYAAHIAGSLFGFGVGMGLLFLRLVPRGPYDLMSMLNQWRRRRQFASLTGRGFDPWSGEPPPHEVRKKKKAKRRQRPGRERAPAERDVIEASSAGSAAPAIAPAAGDEGLDISPEESELSASEIRAAVSEAMLSGEYGTACREYRRLLARDPNAALSQDRQLEIANHLFAESDYAAAVHAYRRYLDCYPGGDPGGKVRLMLGVALVRYLDRPVEAHDILSAALDRLPEGSDRELASALLREIEEER